ncbi:MAG: glycoside hydrolase family 15 protein [Nocardiaceae bacterium]|nr:glycoside hydrolase family 15 protein [Nocardiaceae bacterium]
MPRKRAREFQHPQTLRSYSAIADGERGAMLGSTGNVAWMCAPRWESDACFAGLLGGPGVFAVKPNSSRFVWGGSYEERSMIWRNRWICDDGVVTVREALAYPGDPRRAVLMRRIIATEGDAQVEVILDVRANFGKHRMTHIAKNDGIWTMRSGALHVRLSGARKGRINAAGELRAMVDVREGDYHDIVLEIAENELSDAPVEPSPAWHATEHSWNRAVPRMTGSLADRDAEQAYAVVRGLTSNSGGMVAAPTMSLPERSGRNRNYDYRYAWIRDQCYAGQAVAAVGEGQLLADLVHFVTERVLTDGPDMQPAYTASGNGVPAEKYIDLPGYPGGRPKSGNWINEQFQLDALGDALLLFAAAAPLDMLDTVDWRAVETTVSVIEKRWQEPDGGIWELHNDRWAHSRLNCAAGLRSVGLVAPAPQAAAWNSLADKIVADTSTDCLHATGRWQRAPQDPRVDAALLVPLARGAVPAGDPRTRATLDAVRSELCVDGYVYRFRVDPRPLADAEGAFLVCGYTMAWVTHQCGNDVEALRLFERNRAACGAAGLFTEEYDVDQRTLRGNLPQAFVHAVMLESAVRLADLDPMDKETAS